MCQYDTTLDLGASNTSHAQILDLVGGSKRVLDVGCATGYLAAALADRGCTVSGIEYDPDAAEKARPFLEHLVVGDLTTLDVAEAFGDRTYDVLVFGDVLEHLADPLPVLRTLLALLAPGGSVVISVPNVSHGSLRLALLQGRWQYRDLGLLDRTHIHFFTRVSLLAMVAAAGLAVVDLRTTVLDPLGSEVEVDPNGLPAGVVEWVRSQPDAMSYQFVLRAVRDDADGMAAAVAHERDALKARVRELEARAQQAEAGLVRLEGSRAVRWAAPVRRLWWAARRRMPSRG